MRNVQHEKGQVAASVRRWYDEHGWQRDGATGLFRDTATFSGSGSGSSGAARYEAQSYKDQDRLFGAGRYFMDAASGAVVHAEYVPWSREFSKRICIDISMVALREARVRLEQHGAYVQADIARLPLKDGVVDGGLSAYTIQHVAADEQLAALREIARVLAPGATFCIITGIEPALRAWIYKLLRPFLKKMTYKSKLKVRELYYYPRTPSWWKNVGKEMGLEVDVKTLRLLRPNEYRLIFGGKEWPIRLLRRAESTFPRGTLFFAETAIVMLTKSNCASTSEAEM